MTLTHNRLKELNNLGLRLEHYFVLWSKATRAGLLSSYRVKPETYKLLIDKGYLTLNKTITELGKEIIDYEYLNHESNDDHFEEFWKLYPSSDKFAHYPRTRVVRGNKREARIAYDNAINKVTHQDLCNAIRSCIQTYQHDSLLGNTNRLKYLPRAGKWLRDEQYKVWLDDPTTSLPRTDKIV